MKTVNETNKGKWEILRQETLDFSFNVNTIIGKQDRKIIIRLQRNKWGGEFIQIVEVCFTKIVLCIRN